MAGLLERINQRNGEAQVAANAAGQGMQEEAAKPDAGQTAVAQREAYGNGLAAGPQQEMQDEMPEAGEQEQFTQAESRMAEAIYGPESSQSVIDAVLGAQDPVEGIGKTAFDIVTSLSNEFPDLTEDVKLGLGEAAVEQLVDLVESAEPNVNISEDQMAEALSIAITSYMDGNPDAVDDDMQMYMAEDAPQQLAPQGQPMAPQAPQQPAIAALGAAQAPQ